MSALVSRGGVAACSTSASAARPGPARPRLAVSVTVTVSSRQLHHRRSILQPLRSSGEDAATATADAPDTSDGNSQQALPEISPLEVARLALEADEVDRETLQSALRDLESELARAEDACAAAESRAATLENTVAVAKDQLLRLNADFDNFRRRSKEEKDSVADSVRGDVITSLLPLIDNFELARTQVKAETESELKINNSYQSLYKQMVDIMRGMGIEPVPTTGALFDPALHDAIMREPNDELPDGSVLQEFRKGFRLGDKLLRPAMVKVSVNEGTAPAPTPDE